MTELRKNFYEEVIDQMMIEEVAGLDNDIKETLEMLTTQQKRLAILSILDNNRDLFLRIRKLITDTKVGKTEYITQVVTMLREYVKVGVVEKKTLGEVMTPISLVEEMLNKLPADVWSNPNLKWLDSCNGVGIFPSVVVKRLMDGLVGFEPNEELRYKHIVENMLYVGELQAKNMFLFLCSFDPKDEYNMNIYNGSFLDDSFNTHMKDVWCVEKFDVIVGNPPYQTNNEGERKTHPIWDKFVNKSINILIEGGNLVMVHPSGWRNIDGRFKYIQNTLKTKQIVYLEMHNRTDGIKTFGATTDYDFYCVRNSPNDGTLTIVKGQNGIVENVDLSNLNFIPNGKFYVVNSLIAKNSEDKVEILYSRSTYGTDKNNMNKNNDTEYTYPCVYTTTIDGKINFWYSNSNKKSHLDVPKVIFSNGSSKPVVDTYGIYGLTQFSYGIADNQENLQDICTALKTQKLLDVMKMCALNNSHFYQHKVLSMFRKDFWKEFINEEVTEERNAAPIQD